jgi:hypothetical protein
MDCEQRVWLKNFSNVCRRFKFIIEGGISWKKSIFWQFGVIGHIILD